MTTSPTSFDSQRLIALDLEGVLAPEIWPAVGRATGVDELLLTTRDIAVYEDLMAARLQALEANGLRLPDLLEVVATLEPLDGAVDFLQQVEAAAPVVMLSDTFEQLAAPLLAKLGHPFTLCHRLRLDGDRITGIALRGSTAKREAVWAFQKLGYRVSAAGDSHNDVEMLDAADRGALYAPPPVVCERCPHLPVTNTLPELADWLLAEGH
ncbi:MAG: bifunctional phosphoserine phosphatase/homoserine phosphotransferase ThrH [Actinomycetota bacterium]